MDSVSVCVCAHACQLSGRSSVGSVSVHVVCTRVICGKPSLLGNVCTSALAPSELMGSETFPWAGAKEPLEQEAAFTPGTGRRELTQG